MAGLVDYFSSRERASRCGRVRVQQYFDRSQSRGGGGDELLQFANFLCSGGESAFSEEIFGDPESEQIIMQGRRIDHRRQSSGNVQGFHRVVFEGQIL